MSSNVEGSEQIKRDINRIADGLPNAIRSAIEESLESGESHSKGVVHVVTGRLRDSIRVEMKGDDQGDLVAGGTGGVNYAAIEELGNSSREGHPYLRPGAEVANRELSENIKKKIDALL